MRYKDILEIQSRFSEKLLRDILEALRNDENAHSRQFALTNFEIIMGMLSSFKTKLIERNEEESVEYVMKDLAYPTEKVRRYLEGDRSIDMQAVHFSFETLKKR